MCLTDKAIKLKNEIPGNVKLVAVSKTKSVDKIMDVYNAGHKIFGENRAQELSTKYPLLPKDIEWHFIGHLQKNKVKYIAPYVNTIHSVDSFKLLQEINKEAKKNNRIINCLLEFYIASELTKYGLSYEEALEILNNSGINELDNIKIKGVMGMASLTDNTHIIRKEFRQLKKYFEKIKESFFADDNDFNEISMGMSGDYLIALEEGATIIRIGTLIFG